LEWSVEGHDSCRQSWSLGCALAPEGLLSVLSCTSVSLSKKRTSVAKATSLAILSGTTEVVPFPFETKLKSHSSQATQDRNPAALSHCETESYPFHSKRD